MKKTISTDLTSENITEVLRLLAEMPARLEALRRGLTETQARQGPKPGERSLAEDVAHLLHCEARSTEAIFLALLANEPEFPNLHPERQFGKLVRYDQMTFADLLAYFKFRRAVLLRVLNGLRPAQWARTIREPGKQRRETVYWRARGQALHEAEHSENWKQPLNPLNR
jgi:hypothetical protein